MVWNLLCFPLYLYGEVHISFPYGELPISSQYFPWQHFPGYVALTPLRLCAGWGRETGREEWHKGKVRTELPDLHVHTFIFNLQITYLYLWCLKCIDPAPFSHSCKTFMTGCPLCQPPKIKAGTVYVSLHHEKCTLWWNTLSAKHHQMSLRKQCLFRDRAWIHASALFFPKATARHQKIWGISHLS